MSAQEINVGAVPCLAVRVTFVGELGWELYCPSEYAVGSVGLADGGRPAARADPGRLPRDRIAAVGEGISGVGE